MTTPSSSSSSVVVDWLAKHWFLMVFLLSSGTVMGQYSQRVEKVEDVVKQLAAKDEKIQALSNQVNLLTYRTQKLDESTKQMLDAQTQQSKDIQTLIVLQQRTLTGVKNNAELARELQKSPSR